MTQIGTNGRLLAGRYRLGRVLGRGGMGTVWQAHDEMLGRDVAVKEVRPPEGLTPEQRDVMRRRVLREARAAARISHPSAVTVYDVVDEGGEPWLVLQLLPPRTLADVVTAGGPLPPARVAAIGIDLVDALQAAHRAGVLHRDVKPANVMLSENRAVLTDFGIAVVVDDPALTSTGMLVGSPAFMAPERARGEPPTPAADLWSLGATLFAAVEGDSPFRRDGHLPTLSAVLTEPVPPAVHAGPLQPVLNALLQRDPVQRPDADHTRRMLADALDAARREATVAETRVPVAAAAAASPTAADPTVADPVADPTPSVRPVTPPAAPASTAPARPAAAPAASPVRVDRAAPPTVTQGPPGGRRVLAVAAVVLLVAALAAAAGLYARRGGGVDPAAGAQPSASATPGGGTAPAAQGTTPTTGTSPTPTPSTPTPSDPPETDDTTPSPSGSSGGSGSGGSSGSGSSGSGRAYTDRTGFSVVLPRGWTVSRQGTDVYVREPGTRAYLMIPQTTQPKPDALADWQQQERTASSRFPGYQRIRLERVDYKGWNAADWEFTWRSSGGRQHVLNRNIRVSDRRAYALYWSVPADRWQELRPAFDRAASSFRPAP